MRTRRIAPVLVALALAAPLAACGSDGGSDGAPKRTTTTEPTTTTSAVTEAAYAGPGPHQVGTHTFALPDGRRVLAFYPAAASAKGTPKEVFDIASLLSPELQSQIPAHLRPQYEIDAHPGADPATDGPFPVVLFSHGYAGFPEQSADLVTHLAEWGFVVIAPDHVERSLDGLLGTAGKGITPSTDPKVLSASLDAAIADAKAATSPLHDLLDLDHVALAGHSAGASAVYAAAVSEPRAKAFVAYSLGDGSRGDGQPAPKLPVPKIPGMVMVGTNDGIIPAATSKKVFAGMDSPKYLVEIADAGHLVFSDICLIGRDQGGLIALIKEAGLDLPANLLRLASDGCELDKGDLDPKKAFAAIDHFSVAFLRSALGLDKAPKGIDQATADTFDTADVTVTAEP